LTCLGYGFVDYDSVDAAETAIRALQAAGVQAQLAKVPPSSWLLNFIFIFLFFVTNFYSALTLFVHQEVYAQAITKMYVE